MKIYKSIYDFRADKDTVLTLGTFDGVHIGHRKIIDKLRKSSDELGCQNVLLTFYPHPREVLKGEPEIKLLNTMHEKMALLQQAGVQNLVIHHFDEAFAKLTAAEFVHKILLDIFHIRKIIIGYDHRFGHKRSADINDLIVYGKQNNFEVEQISAQEVNDVSVSSTKIRKSIVEGDILLANKYLGYNYSLTGNVVKGKQLGRTIGFPTANIEIEDNTKLLPQRGVYIVTCNWKDQNLVGMMNIGTKPTVGGTKQEIEVHFLDFNDDLYYQDLTVTVLKRLRSEEKFASLDVLKQQLLKDKVKTREYFSEL